MLLQIVWLCRGAVQFQVAGAGAGHQLGAAQASRQQGGVAQLADAHGHVEAFLHKVDLAIVQIQVQLDARMLLHEIGECWHKVVQTERKRRSQADFAAERGARVGDRLFGLFEVGQDAHGAFVELASRSGQ